MDAVKGLTPEQITAIMTAPVLSVIGLILILIFALIIYICIFKLPPWLDKRDLASTEKGKAEKEFWKTMTELNNKALLEAETRIHTHYEAIINLLKDQFIEKLQDMRSDAQRIEGALTRVETGQHQLVSRSNIEKIGTILFLIFSSLFCIGCSSLLARQQHITNIAKYALTTCKADKTQCEAMDTCTQIATHESSFIKGLNDKLIANNDETAFTADLSAYLAEREVVRVCLKKGITCNVVKTPGSAISYRCNFQKPKG